MLPDYFSVSGIPDAVEVTATITQDCFLHDSFILIPSNITATASITGIGGQLHERLEEGWICHSTVETEIVVAFPV